MNWLPPSIKWNPTNKLFGQFRLKSEHRRAKAAIPTPGSPAIRKLVGSASSCRLYPLHQHHPHGPRYRHHQSDTQDNRGRSEEHTSELQPSTTLFRSPPSGSWSFRRQVAGSTPFINIIPTAHATGIISPIPKNTGVSPCVRSSVRPTVHVPGSAGRTRPPERRESGYPSSRQSSSLNSTLCFFAADLMRFQAASRSESVTPSTCLKREIALRT